MRESCPTFGRRGALAWLAVAGLAALACDSNGSRAGGGEASLRDGGGNPALFGAPSARGVVLFAGDRRTEQWSAFATELGRLGYRVLVVPLPEGNFEAAASAAAEVLTRQGAERIVFVGSGAGVAAALAGARPGAAGVAILNPVGDQALPDATFPGVASLVMASLADRSSSTSAQRLYQAAPEPRRLALYPAKDPAPAAFAAAGELRTAFLDFLHAAFQPANA